MRFKKILILLLSVTALASNTCGLCYEDKDIEKIIRSYGAEGTVVISSLDNETNYIYNSVRANKLLEPACTFRIPESIILLESKSLKNQYQKLKWDGKKRFLNAWNQDHNMKSAFRSSCVWFYQTMFKKTGPKEYNRYLKKIGYGHNLQIQGNVSMLGEHLKISAFKQLDFLKSLYSKQLPISEKSYLALKDIMLEESTEDYNIYSKTGAMTTDEWKGHGWYVGYVTTKKGPFFFATNIDINSFQDLEKRKKITIDVLKKKNII